MRILAVSDFVEPLCCRLPRGGEFAGVRLILSCGDLPSDYLFALRRAFGVPLYYIRGNHDIRHGSYEPGDGMDIHARILSFAGLTILGLEGSHWYNGRPLQYTEAQMRQTVRFLRRRLRRQRRLDIVLTHAPPRHIHDREEPCHRGFQIYRRLIDRYQPRFFLHGHIHRRFAHPSERITQVGRTRVVNCSGYFLFDIGEDHG
jgi:Icc-related predicted phosphoesterase